jgi:hypothetical protein
LKNSRIKSRYDHIYTKGNKLPYFIVTESKNIREVKIRMLGQGENNCNTIYAKKEIINNNWQNSCKSKKLDYICKGD